MRPDDLSGGTFTVSNLGTYGIESFSPILNPPQVAILGVNTIELKPVRRNGAVEFVEHIGLSLTCDHQVIDGAPGARFLKTVKEQIENIESIAGLTVIRDSRFGADLNSISNWMRRRMYDLIVIGAGPGGYEAAAHAGTDGQENRTDREGVPRRGLPERRVHPDQDVPAILEALRRMQKRRCLWRGGLIGEAQSREPWFSEKTKSWPR